MQHFGAPSRLLDWTHSFYVGLYFAIKDLDQGSNGEAALWAVDWRWVESEIHGASKPIFDKDRNLQKLNHFRELLGPNTKPGILKVNAFRLNARLVVQQGTFLASKDISKPFEENLDQVLAIAKDASNNRVIKVRISDHARNEVLQRLIRMNINEASLFPDLQGFSSSLKHLLVFDGILAPGENW